jgi:hypothetical protein
MELIGPISIHITLKGRERVLVSLTYTFQEKMMHVYLDSLSQEPGRNCLVLTLEKGIGDRGRLK